MEKYEHGASESTYDGSSSSSSSKGGESGVSSTPRLNIFSIHKLFPSFNEFSSQNVREKCVFVTDA